MGVSVLQFFHDRAAIENAYGLGRAGTPARHPKPNNPLRDLDERFTDYGSLTSERAPTDRL